MKEKTKKQVGYLLSKSSPLSGSQKERLQSELHSGDVKVKKKRSDQIAAMKRQLSTYA